MNSSNKRNKIIWSFDPTQDPREAKNLITELKIWAKRLDCDVQPVTIFSQSTFNLPSDISLPWKNRLQDIAHTAVSRYFKKTAAKGFLPPEIVFASALSNRKMALEMAKYAEKNNAQLVFANTRAKKTWNPFRLGGFAETLVASSRVPVLLLNTRATPSSRIPSILFPTDFSKNSKNALAMLAPWAKAFKAKVMLFDQVEVPNIYPSEFSDIAQTQTLNLESMMKGVERSRLKKGTEWSELLEKQNVKTSLIVQRQRKYLAADILAAATKEKANLIAIASQSSPTTQAILGSVARDIMLQAKCPVLIFYRPKFTRKVMKTSKMRNQQKHLATRETLLPTSSQPT